MLSNSDQVGNDDRDHLHSHAAFAEMISHGLNDLPSALVLLKSVAEDIEIVVYCGCDV